jgi:hypothetical protein
MEEVSIASSYGLNRGTLLASREGLMSLRLYRDSIVRASMQNKQMKLDMPDSADRRRVDITIDELDVSSWASRAWKEQTFAASAGG